MTTSATQASVCAAGRSGMTQLGFLSSHTWTTAYLVVLDEAVEAVDKVGAIERVAADPDHRRLAQADLRRLEHCFIRERARPGHNADLPRLVDVALQDTGISVSPFQNLGVFTGPRQREFSSH